MSHIPITQGALPSTQLDYKSLSERLGEKVKQLLDEKHMMNAKIISLEETEKTMIDTINTVEYEKDQMEDLLENTKKELNDCKTKIKSIEMDYTNLQKLELKYKEQDSIMTNKEKTILTLNKEVASLRHIMELNSAKFDNEIKNHKRELDEKNSMITNLVNEHKQKIEEYNLTIRNYQINLEVHKKNLDVIDILKQENNKLKLEIEDLNAENNTLKLQTLELEKKP